MRPMSTGDDRRRSTVDWRVTLNARLPAEQPQRMSVTGPGYVLWSPFGLWQMSNMGSIGKTILKDVRQRMKYIKIKLN